MADTIPWIMIPIGVLLILVVVAYVTFRRKEEYNTDYYSMFLMGVAWMAIGLIGNTTMLILGLVFAVTGITHKKEWAKNHVPFSKQLSGKMRNRTLVFIGIIALLTLALIFLILLNAGWLEWALPGWKNA